MARLFSLSKKGIALLTKGLQSAARIICSSWANKFHTCRLRSVFCDVHAAAKNRLNLLCRLRAANSARLFRQSQETGFGPSLGSILNVGARLTPGPIVTDVEADGYPNCQKMQFGTPAQKTQKEVRTDSWVYVRQYCAKIDEAARNRMELIVPELAKRNGVTEKQKADTKWNGYGR